MSIDPELDAYYTRIAAAIPPPEVTTVQARRDRMEAVAAAFPPAPDNVARVDHWITLPGRELLVRLYRARAGRQPGLLFLHGGGWVAGSVATHDGICAAMAQDADIVVASVQYRRSPENPWPAPNDDAFAALQWLSACALTLEIDANRIGIGGDSAGAHLAIGAALEARDRGGPPIAFQALIYPVVDRDFDTPSYHEHAITPTLTRDDMIDYWQCYLPEGTATDDARAVPGRADLSRLPAAYLLVAGLDPLRDDALRFAASLRRAGVATDVKEGPTLTHGFLRASPYVKTAREIQKQFGKFLGEAIRR